LPPQLYISRDTTRELEPRVDSAEILAIEPTY